MIYFSKVTESAIIPERQTRGSAGFDLHSDEETTLWAGEQKLIKTGISVFVGYGNVGLIWPRSGLAVKKQIDTKAGVIDQDFTGEVGVLLRNDGDKPLEIKHGDRIAQLVVTPYAGEAIEVKRLDTTERGLNGFGSSGV